MWHSEDMRIDLENLKEGLKKIRQKHPIKFVVLFGSRAAGNARDESDFDIAVFLDDDTRLFSHPAFGDLLKFFTETLGVFEDRIDLTDLKYADILLRYEITSEGILLFGNENEYENYRLFAFKDYIDAKPLRELELAMIQKCQDKLAATLSLSALS